MQNKYKKQTEQKLPFFRGLCALTIFGLAISSFEVELRASEPNWTMKTEYETELPLQESSKESLQNTSLIFPQASQSQIEIKRSISIQDFMKKTLVHQLTEEAMNYLLEDIALYRDFQVVDSSYIVHVENTIVEDTKGNVNETIVAISIAKSKYDRLRVEISPSDMTEEGLLEEVSVMKDCFPLDVELAHIKFDFVDFLERSPLVDKILDKEPQLLAYIDSKINVVRALQPTDQIQVLLQGRFRDGQLRKLDDVLAVKIMHRKPLDQESNKDKKDSHTKNSNKSYETKTYVFHKVELDAIYDKDQHKTNSELSIASHADQKVNLWFNDNHRVVSYPFLKTPTDHIIVSSGYGELRSYEVHKAIDFAAPIGTPIYAAAAGVVRKSGVGTGYGYMVHIDHKQLGSYSSLYAHMSKRVVRTGEYVHQGQLIGYVGSTGRSTGPHLHYEVRKNNRKMNPYSRSIAKSFRKGYSLQEHRPNVISNYNKVVKMFDQLQQMPTEEVSYLHLRQ